MLCPCRRARCGCHAVGLSRTFLDVNHNLADTGTRSRRVVSLGGRLGRPRCSGVVGPSRRPDRRGGAGHTGLDGCARCCNAGHRALRLDHAAATASLHLHRLRPLEAETPALRALRAEGP